jgi:16S rRNA (uracil1498-N3)-methyltransferase
MTDVCAGEKTSVVVALGPEGGIEEDELQTLIDAGFEPASLGPSILRFETAGVVAMGIARTILTTALLATVARNYHE